MLVPLLQALENRTLDSKREMDIMNALDEMKSLKSRQEKVDSEALLAALQRSADDDRAGARGGGRGCCEGNAAAAVHLCEAPGGRRQRRASERSRRSSGCALPMIVMMAPLQAIPTRSPLPWLLHVVMQPCKCPAADLVTHSTRA